MDFRIIYFATAGLYGNRLSCSLVYLKHRVIPFTVGPIHLFLPYIILFPVNLHLNFSVLLTQNLNAVGKPDPLPTDRAADLVQYLRRCVGIVYTFRIDPSSMIILLQSLPRARILAPQTQRTPHVGNPSPRVRNASELLPQPYPRFL